MIDETFLTTEEFLEYLQVNLRTVYRLIKAGKIPAVRVGRQWRFRKRDIDAWLDSQRLRGTRSTSAAPAPMRPAPGNSRPRVLVVDDEASIRDLLSKTLALAEYDVDVAPDGRSALERMRMYPYDLLIADLKMPGMDGLSVIREAKRYKADLPVIVITGFSTEASAIEALNLGVAGYLTKPFRCRRCSPQPPRPSASSAPRPPGRSGSFRMNDDDRVRHGAGLRRLVARRHEMQFPPATNGAEGRGLACGRGVLRSQSAAAPLGTPS
jgi:excisionase family DNA binding protein